MNIILFEKGIRHFDSKDDRCIHLRKVLHCDIGSSFIAGEINGFRGKGVVTSFDDGVSFDFIPESDDSALYPLTVILGQVRPICMRRILRELVSLGVGRLILTLTDLSEKSYSEAGLYKDGEYKSVLISGAMQAGHTGVTEVLFTENVESALKLAFDDSTHLILDNVIGSESFENLSLEGQITIAIGPERGWSARERQLFTDNDYKPVLMGTRILRTETAAVAGTALTLLKMKNL